MNGEDTPPPFSDEVPADATLLLERLQRGDKAAADELLPLIYERLRASAEGLFRAERNEHTLQPTALVHEAYIKLINQRERAWNGHDHFCAIAALAMRQVLTDHARGKKTAKRDPGGERVALTLVSSPSSSDAVDAEALDACLSQLAEFDARGARVVELRFFGGLTYEQVARVLDLSEASVIRDWRKCKAWLEAKLSGMNG
ncbi:MAG: ECF-type sigma factor [Planctomycetota bacterium]